MSVKSDTKVMFQYLKSETTDILFRDVLDDTY